MEKKIKNYPKFSEPTYTMDYTTIKWVSTSTDEI